MLKSYFLYILLIIPLVGLCERHKNTFDLRVSRAQLLNLIQPQVVPSSPGDRIMKSLNGNRRVKSQCSFPGNFNFRPSNMSLLEQELPVQIRNIDGVQVNLNTMKNEVQLTTG